MARNGAKSDPIAMRDAFDLVTEPAREHALLRKKDSIIERIADIELDMKLPNWELAPPDVIAQTAIALQVLMELAEDIDRRLASAAEVRRALGG